MKSTMYSKFAKEYDLAIQNNIYNAHLERPSLMALIDDVSGLDILDLGCGSGVYADFLIEQGAARVTCLDLSEEMIEIVKDKLGDKVTAYTQNLSQGLPKEKTGSADVIICPLVIHYLEDLPSFFSEVTCVLKKEGYIVFSTHHPFADFQLSQSDNYFEKELINGVWNTIGETVEVTFYRRFLTELINALTVNGLVVTELTEGHVTEDVKKYHLRHMNTYLETLILYL